MQDFITHCPCCNQQLPVKKVPYGLLVVHKELYHDEERNGNNEKFFDELSEKPHTYEQVEEKLDEFCINSGYNTTWFGENVYIDLFKDYHSDPHSVHTLDCINTCVQDNIPFNCYLLPLYTIESPKFKMV